MSDHIHDDSTRLAPLRPAGAARERVIAASMAEIREQLVEPWWLSALELPARHVRVALTAAVIAWLALTLTPTHEPDLVPVVWGEVLATAWGVTGSPSLPQGLSGEDLLVRFAERTP